MINTLRINFTQDYDFSFHFHFILADLTEPDFSQILPGQASFSVDPTGFLRDRSSTLQWWKIGLAFAGPGNSLPTEVFFGEILTPRLNPPQRHTPLSLFFS